VANSIAIALLFLLTRYLFDKTVAIVAAISYALLSLSPSVLGTSAHATQFIVPFALGGTIVLLKAIDSKNIKMFFISGLLFGLAFTIKQHAIFFIAFALSYFTLKTITARPINPKRLIAGNSLLLIGAALPFLLSCAILYNAGVFSKFWFWTFTYADEYASIVSLPDALQIFMKAVPQVIDSWYFLWIIAGIGLTSIFWNDKSRINRYFFLGFFFFSFLRFVRGFISASIISFPCFPPSPCSQVWPQLLRFNGYTKKRLLLLYKLSRVLSSPPLLSILLSTWEIFSSRPLP